MVLVDLTVVVPIFALCGLILILIVALLLYDFCGGRARKARTNYRMYFGFKRTKVVDLSCDPCSGVYQAPLEVCIRSLLKNPVDILVDVQRVPDVQAITANGTRNTVQLLGNDEHYREEFMLYTKPLEFLQPGRYIVRAHIVDSSLRIVGCVHQFCFDVVHNQQDAATCVVELRPPSLPPQEEKKGPYGAGVVSLEQRLRPRPPRIIPEQGEVTVLTPVMIAPHEDSTTPDQIRYSVDGSRPSLLYTGPFTLALPPQTAGEKATRGRCTKIVVRAMAVSAHDCGVTSDVTEALLTVYEAGHSFYDPNVPVPVARVHALEAEMFFDESQLPPNCSILYQLIYIGEARKKPKFSRKKGLIYDGSPVPLREDVAFVYAWTFLNTGHNNNELFLPMEGENEDRRRVRSSAAVYDCTRSLSWNREARGGSTGDASRTLPAPFICIRCKEIEVYFEDPPVGGIICYTLDSTEPAQPNAVVARSHMTELGFSGTSLQIEEKNQKILQLSTHIYNKNEPIRVTSLRTDEVFVTARIFIPIVDRSLVGDSVTGYRYGDRFNRGFTTQ